MRGLERNKETIYYAQYSGETDVISDGLYTGETVPELTDPIALRASVSAARGTSDVDLFGVNTSYTKTVIVDDLACPINEHSWLWIGRTPALPHNYEVVQVARSLNHIAYAVMQVDYQDEPRN